MARRLEVSRSTSIPASTAAERTCATSSSTSNCDRLRLSAARVRHKGVHPRSEGRPERRRHGRLASGPRPGLKSRAACGSTTRRYPSPSAKRRVSSSRCRRTSRRSSVSLEAPGVLTSKGRSKSARAARRTSATRWTSGSGAGRSMRLRADGDGSGALLIRCSSGRLIRCSSGRRRTPRARAWRPRR